MELILKINTSQPESGIIKKAAKIIKEGGIVAFPTETFYGLATLALDIKALKKLFSLKKRPFSLPIAIIINNKNTVYDITKEVSKDAEKLMEKFWPGPLTLVFWAKAHIPDLLTSGMGKIGIRISSHKVARSLAQSVDSPITATSANISGEANPTNVNQIENTFGNGVNLILDGGRASLNKASTILDVTTKPFKILREGAIPKNEIFSCLSPE
jgi:L-threonylcarbamoyladenylate synthase